MTLFNVHIYREMRLTFEHINAETVEAAAETARDRLTEDADEIHGCDGETFAALVDIVGDAEYEHSRLIDFEGERLRNAAPQMLDTLKQLALALAQHQHWLPTMPGHLQEIVSTAIARVTSIPQPTTERRIP